MRPAALHARVARLEATVGTQGLSDEDRAHLLAWQARCAERWQGGPPPTLEQLALLARPGFWTRLQAAWARPAFARACLEALLLQAARPADNDLADQG
jgi:hypothetical protein